MADTSDIRNGLRINYNNDIMSIVEFQHVKPGKGPAFVRTKLKSLTTGKVLENTFPSGHKIDVVRVERRKQQYLYKDGDSYVFMDTNTYEQINVEPNMVPNHQFLKEGDECEFLVKADDDRILQVDLPIAVVLEVTYTEPGVKGDTATNTLKPATLETGAEIKVPLFIDIGEKIKVDTRSGEYMERVKE